MHEDYLSPYAAIDTPALLVDKGILQKNITDMQAKCNRLGVALRPHTKTHKTPDIAKMQMAAGAVGVAVAKIGEAECMVDHGIPDVLIANEPIGPLKMARLAALSQKARITFGVENAVALIQIEQAFSAVDMQANILFEIETGENRSGVVTPEQMLELIRTVKGLGHIHVKGVFSHEGFAYKADSQAECLCMFQNSQRRTLQYANMLRDAGFTCETVSVGATPTAWLCEALLPGVTELRPGTYALMDAAQGNAIGSHARCAATILTTVMSKPTGDRVVSDVGAKGITAQTRRSGICKTHGMGIIKNAETIYASAVYDEHMIFNSPDLAHSVNIGDKLEIIPNHICPVCNLYDELYLVENGQILDKLKIDCRGRPT